jgi:hemerythrin superfamily protein
MAATAKSKQKRTPRGRARKANTTTKRSSRGAKRTSRPRAAKQGKRGQSSSLTQTASQMFAGAARAVRALVPQISGSEPATSLLEQQHRQVERSFAEALGTEDPKARRAAMEQIIQQLTLHTQLEETIFYPAVQGIDTEKAKDMVLEAYEEHHVVKMILKELPKCDPSADNFEAKMTVLKEMVEHHVEEEEQEMFPMAERQLGSERSRELAERMAARAGE